MVASKEPGSALDHAFAILRLISNSEEPLGVNQIATRVGLHKSSVSRILKTLVKHYLVERREDNGRHQLGLGLLTLAAPLLNDLEIVDVAKSSLTALADKTGETVSLYLWDYDAAISVYQALGAHAVRYFSPPGRRNPAHASAAGKAFLAALGDDVLEQCIAAGLEKYTAKTIIDPDRLRKNIADTRRRGYAINHEEFGKDVSAVGTAIYDYRHQCVASIAITVPEYRFTDKHRESLSRQILATAQTISERLGCRSKN